MEVDADPVATGDRFWEMDCLDSWRGIVTAAIVDQPSATACGRVREVDRLLHRIGHEEIEVGDIVEGEADQQATREMGWRLLGDGCPQASETSPLLGAEIRAAPCRRRRARSGPNRN